MFFGLMSAVLIGVKYKSDKRDQYLHHGGWLVKLALWLGFCILPFFFPVGLVNAYCEFCNLSCIAYMHCMYCAVPRVTLIEVVVNYAYIPTASA